MFMVVSLPRLAAWPRCGLYGMCVVKTYKAFAAFSMQGQGLAQAVRSLGRRVNTPY
jgi:hypothetical protein